ncbi:GspE/PulE/PilB domain-containing protein [Anaeromyxobacter oryzae]|uniref:Type II secretion system protein GspE N-terminal domain-containing protein n=1 Tax=Anaeromyxobacter oryzae TaxID=2918170 RepID=A0ABN6MVF1_9BACT|nr:general secretion pathway protein GspE [Anaeromyxobacter oryzae]BDG04916.1 hypothetical protein AMOR_39120 [Anaeromyxobacter oryzae]
MARVRIGELLVARGALDPVQLESALAHQRQWGGRIGRSIVSLGFMKERAVLDAVGAQLGVPVVDLRDREVPREVLALVPQKLIRSRRVLPLARLSEARRGPLQVAVPDAGDLGVLDELAFATGMVVQPLLAADSELDEAIAYHLDGVPRRGDASARRDAIDLPEDTNPLTVLRRGEDEPRN